LTASTKGIFHGKEKSQSEMRQLQQALSLHPKERIQSIGRNRDRPRLSFLSNPAHRQNPASIERQRNGISRRRGAAVVDEPKSGTIKTGVLEYWISGLLD
jgi:hypothetical protein